MVFSEEDIKRGHKVCDIAGCNRRHILEAGTDYGEDEWVKCKACDCWVVESK